MCVLWYVYMYIYLYIYIYTCIHINIASPQWRIYICIIMYIQMYTCTNPVALSSNLSSHHTHTPLLFHTHAYTYYSSSSWHTKRDPITHTHTFSVSLTHTHVAADTEWVYSSIKKMNLVILLICCLSDVSSNFIVCVLRFYKVYDTTSQHTFALRTHVCESEIERACERDRERVCGRVCA